MLVWNRKDFVKKAAKTPNLYFKYGDEVPEDELAEGTKDILLSRGHLIEKKAKAPVLGAPKPLPLPTPAQPTPAPPPKKTESKPKPKSKPKKKGRK